MPLHIVQRGHNWDACFFAEDDYLVYEQWLGEALRSTGCQLHAYVLMTNHVHLLLTPPNPEAVARIVISLGMGILALSSAIMTTTPGHPIELNRF